jgi:hypothetical protein
MFETRASELAPQHLDLQAVQTQNEALRDSTDQYSNLV